MLVLSRHVQERIFVNDNLVITVVAVMGDKVRLGFEAGPEVKIYREEVWDAIRRERQRNRDTRDDAR